MNKFKPVVLLAAACVPGFGHAQNPAYSVSSGTLDIPYLDVGNDAYTVELHVTDVQNLEFIVGDLVKLPPFAARFAQLEDGATRGDDATHVVWFAEVDGSPIWKSVGTVADFLCL